MGPDAIGGRKKLKSCLEGIDNAMVLECPGLLSSEHIRSVWYTTVLGSVKVRRRQYLDKSTGKYRYPLDELLGMEKNDHTTINPDASGSSEAGGPDAFS